MLHGQLTPPHSTTARDVRGVHAAHSPVMRTTNLSDLGRPTPSMTLRMRALMSGCNGTSNWQVVQKQAQEQER